MKTIHKFILANNPQSLRINDITNIEMPEGQILHVDTQSDSICLWALVENDAPKIWKKFAVYFTGVVGSFHGHHHVGTLKLDDGNIILHIFEVGNDA